MGRTADNAHTSMDHIYRPPLPSFIQAFQALKYQLCCIENLNYRVFDVLVEAESPPPPGRRPPGGAIMHPVQPEHWRPPLWSRQVAACLLCRAPAIAVGFKWDAPLSAELLASQLQALGARHAAAAPAEQPGREPSALRGGTDQQGSSSETESEGQVRGSIHIK